MRHYLITNLKQFGTVAANHNVTFVLFSLWFVCASHLNIQVVVVLLSQLDKHREQREDGPGAEEGALGPDHGHAEQGQHHRQQAVEPALQETLPVPLCNIPTHAQSG